MFPSHDQGGGRIAKAFYDLGYKKTVAINTAKSDLALLDLPDEHKFHLDCFGQQGADTVTEKNPKGKRKKKQASFKARHAKNIKRGKTSAAYWANKVKW